MSNRGQMQSPFYLQVICVLLVGHVLAGASKMGISLNLEGFGYLVAAFALGVILPRVRFFSKRATDSRVLYAQRDKGFGGE